MNLQEFPPSPKGGLFGGVIEEQRFYLPVNIIK